MTHPRPTVPRIPPFRAASGSAERINLFQRFANRAAVPSVPSFSGTHEEHDDRLSGMTRSLHRRISGLNIPLGSAHQAQA